MKTLVVQTGDAAELAPLVRADLPELVAALGLLDKDELAGFLRLYSGRAPIKVDAAAYLLDGGWTRDRGPWGGWLSPSGVDWSEPEAVFLQRMNSAARWLEGHGWHVTGAGFSCTCPSMKARGCTCGGASPSFYGYIHELRDPAGGYLRGKEAWLCALRRQVQR